MNSICSSKEGRSIGTLHTLLRSVLILPSLLVVLSWALILTGCWGDPEPPTVCEEGWEGEPSDLVDDEDDDLSLERIVKICKNCRGHLFDTPPCTKCCDNLIPNSQSSENNAWCHQQCTMQIDDGSQSNNGSKAERRRLTNTSACYLGADGEVHCSDSNALHIDYLAIEIMRAIPEDATELVGEDLLADYLTSIPRRHQTLTLEAVESMSTAEWEEMLPIVESTMETIHDQIADTAQNWGLNPHDPDVRNFVLFNWQFTPPVEND